MLAEIEAKKTKLKSVTTHVGTSSPASSGSTETEPAMTDAEMEAIKRERFQVNMDDVVTKLSDQETIPTLSFKLTVAQGGALYRKCTKIDPRYPLPHADILAMSASDIEREYDSIAVQLEELMAKYDGNTKGCFVKLSCRSPKDVTVTGEKIVSIFNKKVESRGVTSANDKLQALYESSLEALKVFSAKEALTLLTQSSRIAFDLALDLKFPESFTTHVVVRKWVEIPLQNEFRGFVHNNQFTALSQYFTQLYFADLEANKPKISEKILAFYETIKHKLPYSSYVIDFAIVGNRVFVLELNVFHVSTGAGLFDWADDMKQLDEGPFAFRVNDSSVALKKHDLLPLWSSLVYDV